MGVAGDLIELAGQLQAACLARGLTVALAESCTGGLVAAALTEVPGSSGYFLGGVVSYANEAKMAFLDVPSEMLEQHGAVSREVAAAMASGARARFGSDLGAGVTGIAGPDGGSIAKPVGLVYVCAEGPDSVAIAEERLTGDRGTIRHAAALRTLALLHAAATRAPA